MNRVKYDKLDLISLKDRFSWKLLLLGNLLYYDIIKSIL